MAASFERMDVGSRDREVEETASCRSTQPPWLIEATGSANDPYYRTLAANMKFRWVGGRCCSPKPPLPFEVAFEAVAFFDFFRIFFFSPPASSPSAVNPDMVLLIPASSSFKGVMSASGVRLDEGAPPPLDLRFRDGVLASLLLLVSPADELPLQRGSSFSLSTRQRASPGWPFLAEDAATTKFGGPAKGLSSSKMANAGGMDLEMGIKR